MQTRHRPQLTISVAVILGDIRAIGPLVAAVPEVDAVKVGAKTLQLVIDSHRLTQGHCYRAPPQGPIACMYGRFASMSVDR